MRIGSLCSGYGGLEAAIAAALAPMGVTASTAWHAEIDPDASDVLEWHTPGVPNHGSLVDFPLDVESVDILTMGVPCQPVSAAGRQQAENDPRWLWPYALTVLTALRPRLLVFENVRNLISIRKGEIWAGILADMRAAGYAVRWLTIGACAVGAPHHRHRVFAVGAYVGPDAPVAVRVPAQECGASRNGAAVLPSPPARDGSTRGEGDAVYWERKRAAGFTGGIPLGAEVVLLATPTASEHTGAGHAADGGMNLRTQVALLPTPRAGDGANYRNNRNNRGEPGGLASITHLEIAERWGRYAAAVARWETVLGRSAPEPTEIGPRGGRRLAPALPEWMMGLPGGYLTGVPDIGRNAALKMAGNGVCPQQGAHAIDLLLGRPLRLDSHVC